MQKRNQRKIIWTPARITAFLTIFALATPFKVMMLLSRPDLTVMYAGLWSYLPGGNPFSESALIASPYFTFSLLPFYAPGLAVAWFVWKWSKDDNMTRSRYFERVIMIVLIQAVLAMIIPCPSSEMVCIPTPTTGIVALLFASKVVKYIETPWSDDP